MPVMRVWKLAFSYNVREITHILVLHPAKKKKKKEKEKKNEPQYYTAKIKNTLPQVNLPD